MHFYVQQQRATGYIVLLKCVQQLHLPVVTRFYGTLHEIQNALYYHKIKINFVSESWKIQLVIKGFHYPKKYAHFSNVRCFDELRICGQEVKNEAGTHVFGYRGSTRPEAAGRVQSQRFSAWKSPTYTCFALLRSGTFSRMSSFRKALKSRQRNHHERSQVIMSLFCWLAR